MIAKIKAAGRGHGRMATKSTRVGCDPSKRAPNRPGSIFIQVDDQYAIGADSLSWHILQRKRYRAGYRWEPIAWYATAEQCVNGLADRAVRTCGAQTLAMLWLSPNASRRLSAGLCGHVLRWRCAHECAPPIKHRLSGSTCSLVWPSRTKASLSA